MSVFGNYALYYDLLYKDKDYKAEINYIYGLIKKYSLEAASILELGCGTGKHAELLAEKGLNIHGIDLSKSMLKKAKVRKSVLSQEIANRLNFDYGDVRNYRTNKNFDTVISLFHVASYQTSNQDLSDYFKTAREHLNKGGMFIFDCWYGPAVLAEKPELRVKRMENDKITVTRIAEPDINLEKNTVDVNYDIFIKNKADNSIEEIKETHKMRYLSKEEIENLMGNNGFELIGAEEWLTGNAPSERTWGVCFIGRKL